MYYKGQKVKTTKGREGVIVAWGTFGRDGQKRFLAVETIEDGVRGISHFTLWKNGMWGRKLGYRGKEGQEFITVDSLLASSKDSLFSTPRTVHVPGIGLLDADDPRAVEYLTKGAKS